MLADFLQGATHVASKKRGRTFAAALRHLGAFGLFSLAIVDGLPLPTFGGPDILTAILAASHHGPWYEYAIAATAGSVIGAFHHLPAGAPRRSCLSAQKLRQRARPGYYAVCSSDGKPGRWPSPPPFLFRLPPASSLRRQGLRTTARRKFLIVVGLCRAARYSLIAILADRYGHHFIQRRPPSRPILGLAAALRRSHCGCSRLRDCDKKAAGEHVRPGGKRISCGRRARRRATTEN